MRENPWTLSQMISSWRLTPAVMWSETSRAFAHRELVLDHPGEVARGDSRRPFSPHRRTPGCTSPPPRLSFSAFCCLWAPSTPCFSYSASTQTDSTASKRVDPTSVAAWTV